MRYKFHQLLLAITFGSIITGVAGCSPTGENAETELVVEDFNKAKIDSLFNLIRKKDKAFGTISIFKDGVEIYTNSVGYSLIEQDLKNNKDTKYKIGSITKTFTASIIMKLIEEEKLSLDTHLDKFFPNIANSDIITIAQMLRHRSGIFSFTDDSNYMKLINDSTSSEKLALQIEGYESAFPPDSTGRYSNSNFALLGFIAEKIEDKSLGEIMQERIYNPLKMTDSYFGVVPPTDNVAISYRKKSEWEKSEWVKATNTSMTWPVGAGAITSTANNVNIFYTALYQGKFVSMESLDEMKSLKDGFGMGMFPDNFGDKKGFFHNGGIDGFRSRAVYFPEDSISVVYLSNGATPIARIDLIVDGVIKIYYGKEYNIPTLLTYEEKNLDQFTGDYDLVDYPGETATVKVIDDRLLISATWEGESADYEVVSYAKNKFSGLEVEIEFVKNAGEWSIVWSYAADREIYKYKKKN